MPNLSKTRGDFTVRLIKFKLQLAGSFSLGRETQVTAPSISVPVFLIKHLMISENKGCES